MRHPTFILEGILGVYNYGCEAIVRGTVGIIRRRWPGARIVYATHSLEYDGQALHGLGLELVHARTKVPRPSFVRRAMGRFRRALGGRVYRQYAWLAEGDCVLSIGGDIYTLAPGEESRDSFPIVEHTRAVLSSRLPVVLWGASVGPFDSNPKAVSEFGSVLAGMRLITARESITVAYLKTLRASAPVGQVADPAFLMEPAAVETDRWSRRRTVGVNLSPTSVRFAFSGAPVQQVCASQAQWLVRLIQTHDVDVLLIPHVVCDWDPNDDDYSYLSQLLANLPESVRGRVQLLPRDLHAPRTKAIIGRCEALIAARMHCAVAGMSMGVPTLMLSYSPKARGMCEYVYGTQDWVVPLTASTEDVVTKAGAMLARRDEMHRLLLERQPAIRRDADRAGDYLAEVLMEGGTQC